MYDTVKHLNPEMAGGVELDKAGVASSVFSF
jgi:hypothetical protein